MSYATMRDALFALDLTDPELRAQPRQHPDVPAAEPGLQEERGESRRVTKPKAVAEMIGTSRQPGGLSLALAAGSGRKN